MKSIIVVGHVPKELSKYCSAFINSDGRMWGNVSGKRENRRGNGLEVPCKYFLKGKRNYLVKAGPVIRDIAERYKERKKIIFSQIAKWFSLIGPDGLISDYKPMGVYAGGAYMCGNRVCDL